MFSFRSSLRVYSLLFLILPTLLQQFSFAVGDPSSQKVNKIETTRGVPNSKHHLYDPSKAGKLFKCANGQKEIPWSNVNNDYCDCEDASDEPGTSACPNGKFYCSNISHKPGYILSSRVNDGVCDPECCDGTDEYNGKIVCPNNCKDVKENELLMRKQASDAQRAGYATKKRYITKGQQLKSERQKEVVKLEDELKQAKIKVVKLKAAMEMAEREEKKAPQDRKSNEDNIDSLQTNEKPANCQTRLAEATKKLQTQRKLISTLMTLLHDLERDHNQNYHDMAVKTAIKGYEEISETVDIDDLDDIINDTQLSLDDGEGEDDSLPYTPFPVRPESKSVIISDFDGAAKLVGDLWKEITVGVEDSWYNLKEWVTGEPDLERLLQGVTRFRDAKSASTAYNSAVTAESDLEKKLKEVKSKLDIDYGLEEEWAAMDGTCMEKDMIGFVYSVCLFGKASQNSAGGGTVSLGNFHQWIGAEDRNQPGYYNKMLFKGGVKCWDGPERSMTLSVECGTENALLDVTEPDKCEYVGRLVSPAACSELVEEVDSQEGEKGERVVKTEKNEKEEKKEGSEKRTHDEF